MSKFSDDELIKDERFGKIILNICKGYAAEIGGNNRILSKETLDEIYHNGLSYFFRLLFLLLAVSRKRFGGALHLEPLMSRSMNILNNLPRYKNEYTLWTDLKRIFDFVYRETGGVLFYRHDYSNLLDRVKISDQYLAPVLFYLKNIETESGIKFRDLNERFVGALYEQWLERALKPLGDDIVFNGDKNKRRTTGSYYTPEYIVDYIVEHTVGARIKILKKELEPGMLKDEAALRDFLGRLKILDPAMGSGHFLLNASNYVVREMTNLPAKYFGDDFAAGNDEKFWKRKTLEYSVFGVDLNPLAVELTKFSFFLAAYSDKKSLALYEKKFKRGNSLIDNDIVDKAAFHWHKEFSAVFENSDGFDCIIGNPPYGNLLSREEKSHILNHYPDPKEKLGDNIVKPFINRAWQLCAAEGYVAFIVPKSLVFVSNWCDSRKLLLEKLTLLEIADNGQCFDGVLLEMITFIAQNNHHGRRKIKVVTHYSPHQKKFLPLQKKINLPLKYFSKESFIISVMNDKEMELFEKIDSLSQPLIKIADIFRGFSLNNKLLSIPDFENPVKILRGRHIERGRLRGFDYIDRSLLPKTSAAGDIVMQEIVAHIYTPEPHIKLIGALNPQAYPAVNTVTNIKLKADAPVSAEYILALLHTDLINLYIYRMIYINSFRTMHFSGKYAEKVPVPVLPSELMEEIGALYRKYADSYPDNKMYEDSIDDILRNYINSL